jgi:hypothetical protein
MTTSFAGSSATDQNLIQKLPFDATPIHRFLLARSIARAGSNLRLAHPKPCQI